MAHQQIDRFPNTAGWSSEVDIFNDITGALGNTERRLEFVCDNALCVEVAFNHGEAIAWNLLKPVLACELNHVQKAIQGKVGIYVCATDNQKRREILIQQVVRLKRYCVIYYL